MEYITEVLTLKWTLETPVGIRNPEEPGGTEGNGANIEAWDRINKSRIVGTHQSNSRITLKLLLFDFA